MSASKALLPMQTPCHTANWYSHVPKRAIYNPYGANHEWGDCNMSIQLGKGIWVGNPPHHMSWERVKHEGVYLTYEHRALGIRCVSCFQRSISVSLNIAEQKVKQDEFETCRYPTNSIRWDSYMTLVQAPSNELMHLSQGSDIRCCLKPIEKMSDETQGRKRPGTGKKRYTRMNSCRSSAGLNP